MEMYNMILFALVAFSVMLGALRLTNSRILNILFGVVFIGIDYYLSTIFLIGYDVYIPSTVTLFVTFIFFCQDGFRLSYGTKDPNSINLPVKSGVKYKYLQFRYYYSNFLVYGGAGSGKTKSIGKWLLEEYMRLGFAGFIYDFKETDYTQTAYNLIKKLEYPHGFYYINFDDVNRSYRFNPLKIIKDRTELMQIMDDMMLSLQPKDAKEDEWFAGSTGILKGVAYKLWDEYPDQCTIPHILLLVLNAGQVELTRFLRSNTIAEAMAGAYLKAEGSEKTQASYLSTLCNKISNIAVDENICYILSGDEFDFNLVDPKNPKLFAISNNFTKNSIYSPVIAMIVSICSRTFTMKNTVPFAFFLDEFTTTKIKNFETLPSVLREYKVAFNMFTQSGAKIESMYGKHDRSSIEANFGNIFFGRTHDVEALKYYPLFFGKEDKEKKSKTAGLSGGSSNNSETISTQREDVYEGKDFSNLEPGEFIGSATQSNVKDFKVRLKMFEMQEDSLPIVKVRTAHDISNNYERIMAEVQSIIRENS